MANRTDSAGESDADSATGNESDADLASGRDADTDFTSGRETSSDQDTPTEDNDTSVGADSDEQVHSEAELLELSATHPILLFDGVCNLCNRWIQFVIERDPEGEFRFAPLQSAIAGELLDAAGYEGEALDSVVLIDDGDYYAKSGAVIRTGRHLGGVYRLLGPFGYVPRQLRDLVYDFVANRRYDWFGKRDQCMMPSPNVRERFLAGGPGGKSE